jgi:hypothetical protein
MGEEVEVRDDILLEVRKPSASMVESETAAMQQA